MSSNVFGFKLMNGMEVVGKLTKETDLAVILEDCLALVFVPDQETGQPNLKLYPFSGLMDSRKMKHPGIEIELFKSNILAKYPLNPAIVEEYCEATSSIILAAAFT